MCMVVGRHAVMGIFYVGVNGEELKNFLVTRG